jgi:hypothetical protein
VAPPAYAGQHEHPVLAQSLHALEHHGGMLPALLG